MGPRTAILTLQNGVDSVAELAAGYGEGPVIGGTTYVATSIVEPGVIEQNGTHRRIVMGEVFGDPPQLSGPRPFIGEALASADIQVETVETGGCPSGRSSSCWCRSPGFTGAARLRIGPL